MGFTGYYIGIKKPHQLNDEAKLFLMLFYNACAPNADNRTASSGLLL